jgi:hypothetical protein
LEHMEHGRNQARFRAGWLESKEIQGVYVFGTHGTNGTMQISKLGECAPETRRQSRGHSVNPYAPASPLRLT